MISDEIILTELHHAKLEESFQVVSDIVSGKADDHNLSGLIMKQDLIEEEEKDSFKINQLKEEPKKRRDGKHEEKRK